MATRKQIIFGVAIGSGALVFILIFAFLLMGNSVLKSEYDHYVRYQLLKRYYDFIVGKLKESNFDLEKIGEWEKEYNFKEIDGLGFYETYYNRPEIYIHPSGKKIMIIIISKNTLYQKYDLSPVYCRTYDFEQDK